MILLGPAFGSSSEAGSLHTAWCAFGSVLRAPRGRGPDAAHRGRTGHRSGLRLSLSACPVAARAIRKRSERGKTARVTARLIRACLAARVPCGLENPQTSLLWGSPFLRRLVAHPRAQVLDLHLCQCGARWRKATKVVLWECVNCPQVALKCSGRRGVCSASCKPHIVLAGRDPSGGLWTRRAQAYPPRFARVFARALADGSEHLCLQNLTRFTHKVCRL